MFIFKKSQIAIPLALALSTSVFGQNLQVICPANQVFTTTGPACSMSFTLPSAQAVSESCPGSPALSYSSSLGNGIGPYWEVPTGSFTIYVKAINGCGETAACQFTATVKEAKKPTAVLVNEMFANLSGEGTLALRARNFDLGSTDNCSEKGKLRFSFSQNPADSTRLFDCDSIGTRAVKIFVIDESGNWIAKQTTVHIADALGSCTNLFIGGKITTEAGQPVEGATVDLQVGGEFSEAKTGEEGGFHFEKIQPGQSVAVTPAKDVNPLNGVSTFDLSLISRHVLGQKPLTPLKLIAADINRNGHVTTGDIVQLRKLILGEIPDFPQNDSWRFVPKSFVFDAANPLGTPAPSAEVFSEMTSSQPGLDFFGVKIGDVSGDANPGNLTGGPASDRSGEGFFLKTTDRAVQPGELVEVAVEADLSTVAGLQATIGFDANSLVFNNLEENLETGFTQNNIGTSRLADGKLPISWFSEDDAKGRMAQLFTLKFRARAAGRLSQMLRLGNLPTNSEAFGRDGLAHNLTLIFEDEQAQAEGPAPALSLEQNEPNPAVGETRIRFSLPEAGRAALRIFDATGREVFQQSADFEAGNNEFRFDASGLGLPGGLYLYRLDAPSGSLCRKLDLIFR